MPWDKKSRKDGIGYTKNAGGSPILQWHERSPERELIASGIFEDCYPFVVTTALGGDYSKCVVRCPESKKALPIAEFEARQLCRNCEHRTGLEPVYPVAESSRAYYLDLAGSTEGQRLHGSSDILVPEGCPCAADRNSSTILPHRKVVRSYHLRKDAKLVPKAWKITFDGSRFRLSLHFRRVFVSKDGKFSNEGFFQHVVADVDTGKTFVTEVTDGTRRARSRFPRVVDDVTYTGKSERLNATIDMRDIVPLMRMLYENVADELVRRGLLDPDRAGIPEGTDPWIENIARLNRFPGMSGNPFPSRWAWPDRLQRKVSSSPRRATVEAMMGHIGLDPSDAELKGAIEAEPLAIESIMVLRELGCEDRAGWLAACRSKEPPRDRPDTRARDVNFFLRRFTANCTRDGFDGIDVLELMLPKTGAHENWSSCVGEMGDMGSEAQRRSTTWLSSFAGNAVTAALNMRFPVSQGLRDMVALLSSSLGQAEDNRSVVDCVDAKLSDAFQSSKVKWQVAPVSPEMAEKALADGSDFMMGYSLHSELATARRVGCRVLVSFSTPASPDLQVYAALERTASLDRRKWKSGLKDGYRDGSVAEDEIPPDVVAASYKIDNVYPEHYGFDTMPVPAAAYDKAVVKWAKKHFVKTSGKSKFVS